MSPFPVLVSGFFQGKYTNTKKENTSKNLKEKVNPGERSNSYVPDSRFGMWVTCSGN